MRKTFKVDARTLLHLGRNSIRDSTTAVLELVKNSYDAGATSVYVTLRATGSDGFIRILDDGHGMSERDIEDYWLHIGYSHKRNKAKRPAGRQPAGEKGIGRLSADRLGAHLELITRQQRGAAHGLFIDWEAFDVDGREISEVEVEELKKPELPPIPESPGETPLQGTSLTIRHLRQPWLEEDVALLHEELALLVSPFDGTTGFKVYFDNDVASSYNGWIDSLLFESALVDLDGTFDGQQLTYTLATRPHIADTPAKVERHRLTISRDQLYSLNREQTLFDAGPLLTELGPFRIVLKFYVRTNEVARGLGVTLGSLKTFLDNNTGVRIYRDGLRVKPYGNPDDPSGDWLNLAARKNRNPASPGRASFRLGPNQLVGAVMITKDANPTLIDTSGREGIVESEAFRELRACVLGCVQLVETAYHNIHQNEERTPEVRNSPVTAVRALSRDLSSFSKNLNNLTGNLRSVPEFPSSTKLLMEQMVVVTKDTNQRIADTVDELDDLVSHYTTFRGLATIGIAASTFGHETQTAIDLLDASLAEISDALEDTPPGVSLASREAIKARSSSRVVAAWGNFALARVKRDKRRRRNVDIVKTVSNVVGELRPALEALEIDIDIVSTPVTLSVLEMDVESMLVNLLTNAVTACLQKSSNRCIRIEVKPEARGRYARGLRLIVADSGPGVAPQFKERIWEPLFTTKQRKNTAGRTEMVGTGLGLYVIREILDEMKGEADVTQDPALLGARFDLWMPGT